MIARCSGKDSVAGKAARRGGRTACGTGLWPAALVVGAVAYFLGLRPWLLTWGATAAEVHGPLPGDEVVPRADLATTRAITIRASAEEVWPWLVQIGESRGGFYSYDWLENLAGLNVQSADRIVPELQGLAVGDAVPLAPVVGLTVKMLEPARALVLHTTMHPLTARPVDLDDPAAGAYVDWTWAFVLDRLDEMTTRLVIRVRGRYEPKPWLTPAVVAVLEPAHFIMERKMLLGIKERAEAAARR